MRSSDWKKSTLGQLTFENEVRASEVKAINRPVYGVSRHTGLTSEAKYVAKSLERYKILNRGMFAYNPMRLNIGSIGYCSTKFEPGLVSPDYVVFGCRGSLWPEFLSYIIETPEWVQWTACAGVGSVRTRIYYEELAQFPINIPPISEQRAIAQILGTLDDRIDLNREMNETLEAMARAIFKKWFVDAVEGGLPDGWRSCKWGDLVALEYGKSLSDYDAEGGDYPVFGTNGKIGTYSEALCQHPGIIVGRKGAYRGIHFCNAPFFVIDTAFYVEPKVPIEMRWAYYELLGQDINSMDSGSAIPSTSREDFYSLPVLVPPFETQQRFAKLLKPLWDRQGQNDKASQTLSALRDTLLPRLISGELRVEIREPTVTEAML